MTMNNYMHLVLVVDRSGSMANLAQECSTSINNLLKAQAEVEGKMTVSLYQFDDQYERVFGPVDIKEAADTKYTLVPRGMTALNDAVGRALTDTGKFLDDLPETLRPDKVVVNIVTDGGENASREFTLNKVQEMIKHQSDKYNWEFVFMASNIDAQGTASQYNIGSSISTRHTGTGYANAYSTVNDVLLTTRTVGGTFASNLAAVATDTDDADAPEIVVDNKS